MHTKHGHGEGSSPALHGETLIVNWDHEEQSFLVALDKRTGKQRWRVARAEDTSWATPIVVEHGGKAQVIVPGTNRLRGYDLANGAVIWECGGLSSNIVASPVAADGVVYAGSSYDTRALLAIRLDGAKGDITGTKQVVWIAPPGHAVRAVAAALRRLALHAAALPGRDRRAWMSRRAKTRAAPFGWRPSATCTPRRSAPPAASTSPAATASRRS